MAWRQPWPIPARTHQNRAALARHVSAIAAAASLWHAVLLHPPAADAMALEAALSVSALRAARVAVLVVRASDGAVLFARQPDEQLAPASNQKIMTALAALAMYGPSHRFTTTVSSDVLPGRQQHVTTLFVHGGGDPALTSEEWWRLSADLRRGGLRGVDDIVVDDSAFDAERWNPEWGAATARAYYPAVGALMANYGSFTVEVRPGTKEDEPLQVSIDPPVPYLALENSGRTINREQQSTVTVDREAGAGVERVLVSGGLALGAAPQIVYRSVLDPALYAGALLRQQLIANEISVTGNVRRGVTPNGAAVLLEYQGKSLVEIVRLLMKYSNNGIAETLCKGLAMSVTQEGSWRGGVEALRRQLTTLGVDVSALTLVDGSGLAPSNRVSPRALVAALRTARQSFAFGPDFISALPIAGIDGTLQQRGANVRAKVRAKTGLLTSAVGLSGFALLADGEEAVFSILVNGYEVADGEVIAAVDGVVAALVESAAHTKRPGNR